MHSNISNREFPSKEDLTTSLFGGVATATITCHVRFHQPFFNEKYSTILIPCRFGRPHDQPKQICLFRYIDLCDGFKSQLYTSPSLEVCTMRIYACRSFDSVTSALSPFVLMLFLTSKITFAKGTYCIYIPGQKITAPFQCRNK